MNFIKRAFRAPRRDARSAPGRPRRHPRRRSPALWSVADADTTIYLFGTIHLLPENFQWRTARFDQAIDSSQQLVVETIVDDKDPTKIMAAMSSLPSRQPSAARRARPPPSAPRSPQRSRRAAFRRRRSTGWRPGPRPSSCSATSSRHGPQRRGRRRGSASQQLHDQGQADRRARNQRRAAGLLRHASRKGPAAAPRRRDRRPRRT